MLLQILADAFIKSNNSFTYVLLSTCFHKRNIDFAVLRSKKFQQQLIEREYKTHKVRKQLSEVVKISRETARQPAIIFIIF